jgi:hypothetical protein
LPFQAREPKGGGGGEEKERQGNETQERQMNFREVLKFFIYYLLLFFGPQQPTLFSQGDRHSRRHNLYIRPSFAQRIFTLTTEPNQSGIRPD